MIRNYLGFPRGITGAELAARAQEQAVSLGAEFLLTSHVVSLEGDECEHVITTAEGTQVKARAVIVATGASYNRLEVDGIDRLLGKGVFYGAATSEAAAQAGRDVFVVGGANSAGQAAVHLARYAGTVTLLVRGDALTMSDYLVKQLERASNVRIRLNTQIVAVEGERRLEALAVRDTARGTTERLAGTALFVLIGAGPHTSWLDKTLQLDESGRILTGDNVVLGIGGAPFEWLEERAPYPLETSIPGVFAVGDVRHGSPRNVSAAVADGAIAVRSVYEYLHEVG
jgi:thioredoxin reductase (NADPH)